MLSENQSSYIRHHLRIVLFVSMQHLQADNLQMLFSEPIFPSDPLLIILSLGFRRIATSINSLSRKGTRPSTPQAASDLFARRQSYKMKFTEFFLQFLHEKLWHQELYENIDILRKFHQHLHLKEPSSLPLI